MSRGKCIKVIITVGPQKNKLGKTIYNRDVAIKKLSYTVNKKKKTPLPVGWRFI